MTGILRFCRRWPGLVLLLPLLFPLAACDRGSTSAAAGGGADGLLWIVAHGASLFGPDSLLGVDPGNGRIVRSLEVENLGDGLAIGEGALWATDPRSNAVLRLDLRSGRTDTIPLGGDARPESIVIADGAVWVASGSDVKVRRIDPARREVIAEIQLGEDRAIDDVVRLVATESAIWAVQFFGDHDLHRIDPATNTVAARVERIGDGAVMVAHGEGALWVASVHDGRVHRIDPATLEVVASPQVGRRPFGVAVSEGGVWVTNRGDESVARVDPSTNRLVATIPVPGEPYSVAVSGGSVWVGAGESLVRIDPQTNQIAATLQRAGRIGALAAPR